MAIKDKMYKGIVEEIESTIKEDRGKVIVKIEEAKEVAELLADLSTDRSDASSLTNQYIARIKNICK